MTAVIGILNKNAVAIAADSAVTVTGSNGRKIYNTANKIFTLSKYHPVSIVIYNSAEFIATPWEIIIKMYRSNLEDRSFPRLQNYAEDFFKFLKTKKFFSEEETINQYLKSLIYLSIEDFIRKAYEAAMFDEGLILKTEEEGKKIIRSHLKSILDSEIADLKASDKLKDFSKLTKTNFNKLTKDIIEEIIEDQFDGIVNGPVKTKYTTFLYNYIKSRRFYGPWTGLVFAGYGDDEIYPVTISTKVAGVFDGKIRFFTQHREQVSDENSGLIMPFAQRDVIDTLISGISPDIDETLSSTFNNILRGYNQHLISLVEEKNPELAEALEKLDVDAVCSQFVNEIKDVRRIKHIEPTVNTVSILSKEDLAEMAESLIYLTYLKRRISSHEESVGGPVDVAIISKGDGFIWIKRKHYFEEKYNPHFKQNYLKP